ncbi:MAG: CoB--CoM heterodisulfide reductase iron-sulfur subunit B family protein [Candidatus Helarchaeales archaeon]
MSDEYALFIGCLIANRFPYVEAAGRKVMDKLDIKYKDVPEFGCCPDPVGMHNVKESTWLAAAAYNLCIAEEKELDILTMCNGCFETLKSAWYELSHHPHKKDEVNEILSKVGKEYKGTIEVKHLLEILYNDIGIEKIAEATSKDMSGLKIAAFYGCHYGRPSYILNFDDPIRPRSLDEIIEATGARSMEYLKKYQCCGSAISGIVEEAQINMLESKLKQIKRVNADALVVICPACYSQFEMGQSKVNKKFEGADYKIPVLYFAEYLALAFGEKPEELGVKFHRVKLNPLLAKIA